MTSAPTAKHIVNQKKESLRVDAKVKPKRRANKEVLAKRDYEQCVGPAITPKKLEKVGPSATIRKRRPEKLPLAYCSSYVIQLTKLDNELSKDEVAIDKEVIRFVMANLKQGVEVKMNVINICSFILNDLERKRDIVIPRRLFMSCDQSVFLAGSSSTNITGFLSVEKFSKGVNYRWFLYIGAVGIGVVSDLDLDFLRDLFGGVSSDCFRDRILLVCGLPPYTLFAFPSLAIDIECLELVVWVLDKC
ncbi:hypothetical protein Cgig2_019774 [Carnegiea gigantea]|uniref:Uncharacterized protein n=1 Tax=Carnegiea gigantea TaxID=171969 RepID=A0A9Q1JIP1_9CARY|nr:hypothetical protein Cgig2_019774 [Carnegiea gigantea]